MKRQSRGKAPLRPIVVFIYHKKSEVYQELSDFLGIPGKVFEQQTMLRTLLTLGQESAFVQAQLWIDQLNALNPTEELRTVRRKTKIPESPLSEDADGPDDMNDRLRYKIYLRLDNPTDSAIYAFLFTTVPELLSGYSRKRLPGIVRQIFLRQALISGMKIYRENA